MQIDERREDLRFRVLRVLEQHPEFSQRDIAVSLGVSLGRVNYCVRALIDKGLVKVENFRSSPHKLGYVHVLTAKGIAERAALAGRFLRRKVQEYEGLRIEIESLEKELHADAVEKAKSGWAAVA